MDQPEDDCTSLDQKKVPSSHETLESTPLRPPPPHHLPWLVLDSCHPFYIHNQCFLSGKTVPRTFASDPVMIKYDWSCVGSVEGWLIMAQSNPMYPAKIFMGPNYPIINLMDPILNFMDPVSNARVALPSQLTIASPGNYRHDFFYKVVASCSPMEQQRCLVAAIVPGPKTSDLKLVRRDLVICRLTHKSWTMIKFAEEDHKFLFCDIEIIGRKLYAATKNLLMLFHIKDTKDDDGYHLSYKLVETVSLESYKRPVEWLYDYWGLEKEKYMQIFELGPYLVKDATSKELFIIYRDVSWLRSLPITYRTEGFRVLKLENSIPNCSRLVEVSDLGDRIMFLSKLSNQLVIYSGNGVTGSGDKTTSIKRNCICYAFNWPGVILPGGDFGVFSLTHKRITSLTFPEEERPAELFFGSTAWFNPYLNHNIAAT